MDLIEQVKRNKKNQTPRSVIKLLETHGFRYCRSTGDHDFYKRKGFRPIPIPIRQNPLGIHIVQEVIRTIEEAIEIDGNNNE
ncbi:MAG: type II toxin-antitoxin system HicA family toxin [Bacteroidales bacterium]|nr:type II toxin-antitoxin system HicA family toxin [Bacteroidales bacterium]